MSPIPTFVGMGPNPSFDDVTRKINTLVMELRNLMLGLDTLNIIELNASVITALSITADKIAAGEITADKMDVTELSAITANLGTITAGLLNAVTILSSTITGSTVQTAASGVYPRAELSEGNYIRAEHDAVTRVGLVPAFSAFGPAVMWDTAFGQLGIFYNALDDSFNIYSPTKDITIKSDSGNINLDTPSGSVYVNGVPL